MVDRRGGDLVDVDEILAVDAPYRAVGDPFAVDEDEGRQVAQLQLRATGCVLVIVVGVAGAGVAAAGEGRNGFAQDFQRVGGHPALLQLRGIEGDDRDRRLVRLRREERSGDDDLLQLGFGLVVVVVRPLRRVHWRGAQEAQGRQQNELRTENSA